MITEKGEIIDKESFKNYFFQFESLSDMQEKLSETRNAQKNEELVQEIRSRIIDLNS